MTSAQWTPSRAASARSAALATSSPSARCTPRTDMYARPRRVCTMCRVCRDAPPVKGARSSRSSTAPGQAVSPAGTSLTERSHPQIRPDGPARPGGCSLRPCRWLGRFSGDGGGPRPLRPPRRVPREGRWRPSALHRRGRPKTRTQPLGRADGSAGLAQRSCRPRAGMQPSCFRPQTGISPPSPELPSEPPHTRTMADNPDGG